MKLNYRDKVILAVVLALIVLIGGFFGLIKPKSNEIKENKATLAARQAERQTKSERSQKSSPSQKKSKSSTMRQARFPRYSFLWKK